MRIALLALALGACKDKAQDERARPAAAAPAATPVVAAPQTPRLDSADAEGRCVNETPDRPFDALYFYPSRSELFVPTSKQSAFRVPIRIEPGKANVEFMYKWAADEKSAPTNHAGAVTVRGDGKLKFQLETMKGSTCARERFEAFLQSLDQLSLASGTFRDDVTKDEITFVAGEQKLLTKDKGRETAAFYRVATHDPQGSWTLFVSSEPPSSSRPTVWVQWALTRVGDDAVVVDYMGRFKRTYKRVRGPASTNQDATR